MRNLDGAVMRPGSFQARRLSPLSRYKAISKPPRLKSAGVNLMETSRPAKS
jgi:hypothetical protein